MKRLALLCALVCLWAQSAHAQALNNGLQPSTGGPTPLTMRISDGDLSSILGTYQFKATNVVLVANATNYIYLDLGATPPTLTVNQTGFPATPIYKIAVAVTNTIQITSLTDSRPPFNNTVGGGGGGGNPPGSPINSPQCNNFGASFKSCSLNSEVLYVSPSGNDSNSGLSWDTAKLTVYGALQALPGGSTGSYGQGTIYVADGSSANPTSGAGIWLMGSGDPNFASPPAGWLKQAFPYETVTIVGMPVQNVGPNAHKNRANLNAGSPSGTTHPGMWISGVAAPLVVQNIAFIGSGGTGRGIVIGECSNGDRTGTCGSPGHTFENVAASAANFAGDGPGIDITGDSYWLFFSDMSVGGNAVTAGGGRTSNQAAAILIDGTGNPGNGLIYIKNSNLATGGIKVIPGTTTPGVYHFENITEEGDFVHDMPPVVWFTSGLPATGVLEQINLADPGPTPNPPVQNDAGAWGLVMSDINGTAPPAGGGVILSEYLVNLQNSTSSPRDQGQVGFFDGYMVGETDVARRISGLSNNRFTNQANNNTATWTTTNFAGSQTITTGQSDPYGGTLAAKVSSSAATVESAQLGPCVSYTTNVGDWIVGGVWVQGMSPANQSLSLSCSGFGTPTFSKTNGANGMIVGSGSDWQFRWAAGKVSGGTATKLGLQANFSNTLTPTMYGPVFYVIPAGTLSDNEVEELAAAMNSVDNACPAGSTCNVNGHPLSVDQLNIRSGGTANAATYWATNTTLGNIPGTVTGQGFTAQNGSAPAFASPGIQDGNSGSAITSTPYTIQCDSGTTLLDRAHILRFQSGAGTVTVPLSTASGCTAGFVLSVIDDGAGTLTFNRTSPDTFSLFGATTPNADGATSFTLTNGQYATLTQGASGIWEVRGGGGYAGLAPGTNTNTGLFAQSQGGTFTSSQQNDYLESSLNSCSPSTEFNAIQSAHATEALVGCAATPSGATQKAIFGVAAYTTTNQSSSGGTVADTVGVYGTCRSLTSGGGCWGVNGGASDGWPSTGVASRLEGGEFDCWVANAGSTCFGVQATGNMTAQPTQSEVNYGGAPAFVASAISGGQWTAGFACAPGASENGSSHGNCLDIGPTAASGTVGSQSIFFHTLLSGVNQTAFMVVVPTSGGPNVVMVPTSTNNGSDVALIPPAHGTASGMNPGSLLSAGTCAFSSSTTCTFTFTNAYTSAPICTATEVGTTPASLIDVEVSVTASVLTLTAASSNSATWNWICMPAAN